MASEDRVREVVDAYVSRMRHEVDVQADTLLSAMLALVPTEPEPPPPPPPAPAPDPAPAIERLQRLLDAVRELDAARGLAPTFGALMRTVAREAVRLALWRLDGDTLVPLDHRGYGVAAAPLSVPLSAAGPVALVVATRLASHVTGPTADDHGVMASLRLSDDATGVALPLVVGEHVVAVVWADNEGRAETAVDARLWTAAVEVIVRHASVCLERTTSVRTVELLARSPVPATPAPVAEDEEEDEWVPFT